jgi:hypothetical protein
LLLRRPASLLMLSAISWAVWIPVHEKAAEAACNVTPSVAAGFRGFKGTIDRPFAVPNEEGVTIELKAPCDSGSFPADVAVTLIFEPIDGPNGVKRARNAIVVRSDCSTWVDSEQQRACREELNQGMPAGPQGEAYCWEDKKLTVNGTKVAFTFPDSTHKKDDKDEKDEKDEKDKNLKPPGPSEEFGFAGPVTIAVVSATTEKLPCGLATTTCGEFRNRDSLSACVDDLYSVDDTACPPSVKSTFPSFTALPGLNDFKKICSKDFDILPKCDAISKAPDLRFALDQNGNALMPVKWRGVLRKKGTGSATPLQDCPVGDVCDNRLVSGSTAVKAFETMNDPIDLSSSALASFNLQGGTFQPPPVFLADNNLPHELSLKGDADKGQSVLRFSRCPDSGPTCANPAFDFSGRVAGQGVGPVIIYREQERRVCDGGTNDGQLCAADPSSCGQVCDKPGSCQPVACVAYRGIAGAFKARP